MSNLRVQSVNSETKKFTTGKKTLNITELSESLFGSFISKPVINDTI
jgi:hypothetical protein